MADEANPAVADPNAAHSTVAETQPPAPNPVATEQAPTASEPLSPTPNDSQEIDFDKVDADTYAKLQAQLRAEGQAPTAVTPPQPDGDTPPVVETAPPEKPAEPAPPKPATEPADERQPQFRFRPRNDLEKRAFEIYKRNEDLSIEECVERAKAETGTTPTDAPQRSPEQIEEEIAKVKALKKQAANDADTLGMYDADEKIEALLNERGQILNRQRADEEAEAQQWETKVASYKAEAIKYYPDTKDTKTELSKEIAAIAKQLTELNDPIMQQPDAPLVVTQMAAKKLKIAPIDPNAPAPAATAPPAKEPASTLTSPSPATRPAIQPAPGSLRAAPPVQHGQLEQKIDGLKSLDDYEAFKEELKRGNAAQAA